MNEETAHNPFSSGLWLCWISVFVLPVGLLAIGGGPCAGPRNALGSLILLGVGGGAAGAAIYGVIRVLRGIKAKAISMLLWSVLSVACAGFAAFVSCVYLLLGFVSLEAYLRY